jgi:adenylate cyclase
MHLPTRLSAQHPLLKIAAAVLIALFASALAAGALGSRFGSFIRTFDNVIYDRMYALRPPEDRSGGSVVIVAVDETSLKEVNEGIFGDPFGWPWPRVAWAVLIPYLERCGAKVVAFDVLFSERSVYQRELSDDDKLAEAINSAKIPVVLGTNVSRRDGSPGRLAPKVKSPIFGAVNYEYGQFRQYDPVVFGAPSLGLRTASVAAGVAPAQMHNETFYPHFYGPGARPDGTGTFRYLRASWVIRAAIELAENGRMTSQFGFDPAVFRDKIVLVGFTAPALGDIKAAPFLRGAYNRENYPGVELHATAVENLLQRHRAYPLSTGIVALCTFLSSALAAVGVTLPRRTSVKLVAAAATAGALAVLAGLLFRGRTIHWLPLAMPLMALVFSTVAAFAWSYLTEGRQRQFFFRALSQYLSPDVAAEVERSGQLSLSGERRVLTVMFSDIAGFTTLSEELEERITEVLNFYLGEMSAVVYETGGTLDKYIGDAIMAFWNAPVEQPDHAARACRTALAMKKREREIQPRLAELGAAKLMTRIGLHTGPMTFGNMGSPQKFNYTVIGDAVNFGSRLEGANKFYGSEVLISENTAELVRGSFVVRRLDLLKVKGKSIPMAVYELMHEGPADDALRTRVEKYEKGLALFQKQKWDEAEAVLSELTRDFPLDTPALNLIGRIYKLRADPPAPDWDGVYEAKDK